MDAGFCARVILGATGSRKTEGIIKEKIVVPVVVVGKVGKPAKWLCGGGLRGCGVF